MPRLTRKSLPEDAPPRGRSRTPAKAAKADTAAASSSSSTSAGGKAKAENVVESKRPGRSASRGKAAAASPASQTPAVVRGSRSRSRSAAPKEKKTAAPAKRGREKAAEEEAEQVVPKKARGRGQSAGKSPSSAETKQRRGRSPTKAAASAKSKAKSPAAARAVSTSRKGKSPAAASPARKGKSPAKRPVTTPRTAKSPAASQKTKGKSPAKAAAFASGRAKSASTSRSPRTPAAKTVGKKKDEAKKSTPRSRSAPTPPSRGSKSPRTPATKSGSKADVKKSSPRGRGGAASASTPRGRSRQSAETLAPQEEAEKVEEEKKETQKDETEQEEKDDAEEIKNAEADVEMDTDKDAAEVEKEASKDKEESVASLEAESESAVASVEATSPEKTDLSASGNAEEPMEVEEAVVASPSEEGQKKDPISAVSDLQQDNNNSETNNIPSPPHSAVKRKFEEVAEETESKPSAKQARLNGTETEDMEVKVSQSPAAEAEPSEEDLLKDYVVVNKDEVPAPDSSEVVASVPSEHKETPHADKILPAAEEAKEAEKGPGSSSSGSGHVFVVPLTTAEEIRACAYPSTGHPPEREDMSSMAVEVGSTTDSEILSRNLEVNEELSATVSDVESAADSSIVDDDADKLAAPEKTPESIPSTGAPSCAGNISSPDFEAGVQDNLCSTPVVAKSIPSVSVDENNSGSTIGGLSVSEPVAASNEAPVSHSETAQPATQSIPTGDLHNSSSPSPLVPEPAIHRAAAAPPSSQSLVTPSLGIPDPAFLSTYSSPGILNRAYVPNPALQADSSITPDKRFSVVSYNILAECNRVKADYSYTGEEFLCQGYRHGLLMKELQYLDGDVVCLQEVNPLYFNNTLLPDMKSLGYDGLMMRRTKDIYDEGEATFFKTSVFELESSNGMSLSKVAFQEVEMAGVNAEVGAALKKYLDRADVVLVTRLRCKNGSRVVTVGNIHVVWDFSRCPDVQCIQAACAIKEVVKMSGNGGSHIICGDFNSEWTTPAYQMVVDGSLSDSSVATLQKVDNLELENGAKSLVSHLRQSFQHPSSPLRSAYSTVTKSEPEITSLTSFMESAVDYQFYSSNSLVPVGVLKTVDRAVVKATGGLPSKDFPSDHVSMKSVMAFRT